MKYPKKKRTGEIVTRTTVTAEECGYNPERMIKKFSKKVKKDGIMEEIRRRSFYVKPAVERAQRKRDRKRLIQKVNKQREELFTVKGSPKNRR
tara:strand:- start:958 stop:1236 length:279 start_codon:yes stop_codon:yes gene_type:complete